MIERFLFPHGPQRIVIADAAACLPRRPKIFFEEWDEPRIIMDWSHLYV